MSDARGEQDEEAYGAGLSAGWGHASHVEAYGPTPDTSVPGDYTAHGEAWRGGYAAGKAAFAQMAQDTEHRLLLGGEPGSVQARCPCPAGWVSQVYPVDEDEVSWEFRFHMPELRAQMAAHSGDGPDQTWCNWCGQPMTPNAYGDWITCPNAGSPEICTDCCGED